MTTSIAISIHALREESDYYLKWQPLSVGISIHALREESDSFKNCFAKKCLKISIHALREESDILNLLILAFMDINFNPRSP